MENNLYISLSTFAEYSSSPLDLLKESKIPFILNQSKKRVTKDELLAVAKDITGIVAGVEQYDASLLSQMPKLKCISRCGVGLDSIDLKYAEEKGIVIRNTPDVVIEPVTDLTIAMIYDCLRKLTFHTALLKKGRWEKLTGNNLSGKTVGIIGTGRIGKSVAQKLQKLGCKVIATDVIPDKKWASENYIELDTLENLLVSSDIITMHLAGSKETILGEHEFGLLKKNVSIINTSRASYINEAALLNFLKENPDASAALDVFSVEPYSGDLINLENIILTPHIATLTQESRTQMEYEAVRNLLSEMS